MKNEFDILDSFLQQKVEEANFKASDQDWQKALALLDEEETKKKPFPFWRGFSLSILVLLVSVATYLFSGHKLQKNKQDSNNNKNHIVTNAIVDNTTFDEKNIEANISGTKTNSNLPNSSEVLHSNEINDVSTTKPYSALSENTNTEKPPKTSITNDVQNNELLKVNTNHLNRKAQKRNKNLQNNNINTSSYNKSSLKDIITSDKSQKHLSRNKTNLANTELVTNTNNNQIQPTINQTIHKTFVPIDTQVFSLPKNINPLVSNPRYLASLTNYQETYNDKLTIIHLKQNTDTANRTDLQIPATNNKESIPQEPFKQTPLQYIIMAGMYYNNAFKGNVASPVSIGFAPYFSFGIEKRFSNALSFNTHVGFTYYNALNTMHQISNSRYNFGFDSTNYEYRYKKLLQLQIPLTLNYNISNKHYVFGGLGIAYMLLALGNESSTLNTLKPIQTINGPTYTSSTLSSTKNVVTKDGINMLDIYAQLGYGYQLNRSLMLQTSFQYGFVDITKNSYFNNTLKNNTKRISIGVKYSLPHKK